MRELGAKGSDADMADDQFYEFWYELGCPYTWLGTVDKPGRIVRYIQSDRGPGGQRVNLLPVYDVCVTPGR